MVRERGREGGKKERKTFRKNHTKNSHTREGGRVTYLAVHLYLISLVQI